MSKLSGVLKQATGRDELAFTTLYPLSNHINGERLFTQVLRHCSDCLKCDVAEGNLPYRRLLWHLSEVTCCPIHGVSLAESTCGRPVEEQLPAWERKVFPGVCTRCGSVAYRCIDKILIQTSIEEMWKAKQYSELLAKIDLISSSDPQAVKSRILEYAIERERGIAGLASEQACRSLCSGAGSALRPRGFRWVAS